MRTIDNLSVFLLLGSAPGWQMGLDYLSAGLGSSLLLILLIGAIGATRADWNQPISRYSSSSHDK